MSPTPDITEHIPVDLGTTAVVASANDRSRWDVMFGDLGFNLRPSKETPYQRGTEQSRKQQLDVSESPGEQSLSSWWTRSQDSWDMGAGINWYEPGTEPETYKRFANSQGVDVWTPGELRLLPKIAGSESAVNSFYASMHRNGVRGYLQAQSAATWAHLRWLDAAGTTVAASTNLAAGTALTRPAIGGHTVWMGVTNGVIEWVPITTSSSVLPPKWTCTGTPRAWWVKSRLIVALGNILYELAPSAASGTLASAASVLYTHPESDWEWVGVSETGAAILAAGRSGGQSAIYRFLLEQDELNQPVLSGGSIAATFPAGEQVRCMDVYLSTQVVIGTSRGIRVGVTNEQGLLQYGPLTVQLTNAPGDILFDDRFAYVTVTEALPDGMSGLVRLDLSAPIGDTGRYAWAWDLSAGSTSDLHSVCMFVGTVEGVTDQYWFLSGDAGYSGNTIGGRFVESGWVETGRVRFGTSEPKAFRLARLVCSTEGGRVRLDATTPSGTEVRVIEFDDSFVTSDQVAIQIPGAVQTHQYLSFKITLTGGDIEELGSSGLFSSGTSPVVNGVAFKAVPAAARVRLFQYPLSLFDREQNRFGAGLAMGSGDAYQRLRELERLEETGAPVTVRDNRTGETYTGQIDTVDFTDPTPPDGHESGFGGVATVVVRRL